MLDEAISLQHFRRIEWGSCQGNIIFENCLLTLPREIPLAGCHALLGAEENFLYEKLRALRFYALKRIFLKR
jgi:hypothetical protein